MLNGEFRFGWKGKERKGRSARVDVWTGAAGMVPLGLERQGKSWSGRRVPALCGTEWTGLAGKDWIARLVNASCGRQGPVMWGKSRCGLEWPGMAGMVLQGLARTGAERFGRQGWSKRVLAGCGLLGKGEAGKSR